MLYGWPRLDGYCGRAGAVLERGGDLSLTTTDAGDPAGVVDRGDTGCAELEEREVARARQRVVHERRSQRLDVGRRRRPPRHRLPDALRQPAVDLPLDDERVDEMAGIVDRHHLQQPRLAGLPVDSSIAIWQSNGHVWFFGSMNASSLSPGVRPGSGPRAA